MVRSLKKLVNIAKDISDTRKSHDVSMDLTESLLRHVAVVSIAAYRHSGAKDKTLNRAIPEQLPRVSMGSWVNFIGQLSATNRDYFPDGFYESFLAPLKSKMSDSNVSLAYSGIMTCLSHLESQDDKPVNFEGNQTKCSPLEFLSRMVQYRNKFIGHGTHTLPNYVATFAPILKKGWLFT